MSEPYRESAARYWAAGWRGILPIPPRSKQLKLRGWTGHSGATPSYADIQSWCDGAEGDGNIALRLPDGVLGIDCDAYGAKQGATTLLNRETDWGPLPDTWRSSARPEPSGIYFYRVPLGLAWPGELGPNVDIVQYAHRYAVVWPSFNPDADAPYRWWAPSGSEMPYVVPRLDELPALPQRWIDGLSSGLYHPDAKATITDERTTAWLDEHNCDGTCRTVRHAQTQIATRFRHGSRHEVLTGGLLALVRLGEQGHRGFSAALVVIKDAFRLAAGDPSRGAERSTEQLEGEWARAVTGAVAIVLAQPTRSGPVRACSCDVELSSLIPPPDVDDGRPRPTERAEPCSPVTAADTTGLVSTSITPPAQSFSAQSAETSQTSATRPLTMLELEVQRQRLNREARRILDQEEQSKSLTWPEGVLTVTEELAIPDQPIAYTVQHVMPSQSNVLLTAQYKSGKTTMVNNLARSLADGTPFLGRFNMSKLDGRVAIWNYEVGRDMYRRWLRETNILNTDDVTLFNLRGHRMPLNVTTVEDRIVEWLQEREIAFWIVDPFARAFVGSGDENSNNDVGQFLDTIDVIKERAGVRDLVLTAHTGRGEQAEGTERARGATRLDDWADVRWILTRDAGGTAYFRATGRDVTWPESQLAYEDETRTLTLGEKSRTELRADQMMDAICAVVRRSPGIGTRALREGVKDLLGTMSVKLFDDARGVLKRSDRLKVEQSGSALGHYLTSIDDLGVIISE